MLSKEWIEEHTNKILAGLGALLLLLGSSGDSTPTVLPRSNGPVSSTLKSCRTGPQDKNADPQVWPQIITALETYLKEYSGTAPANDAELDLANAYFQTQQYENALKYNKKVLEQQVPRSKPQIPGPVPAGFYL